MSYVDHPPEARFGAWVWRTRSVIGRVVCVWAASASWWLSDRGIFLIFGETLYVVLHLFAFLAPELDGKWRLTSFGRSKLYLTRRYTQNCVSHSRHIFQALNSTLYSHCSSAEDMS
ncbi:hypothetical protein B0H10DRAFT_1398296 [Mycena sp. CBHHK59/15]|nr:hypothetical protein B0H10DRAFT_1398296 [Mycena sp. CBHHK59/15]